MLVVDASAIVELLLGRPRAAEVERHCSAHGFELHAPHLLDIEVVSAVRRVCALGEAPLERAEQAIGDLLELPVERYPHTVLIHGVWGARDHLSAYDAAYLVLAEALAGDGASLLTADRRFARAASARALVPVIAV